jgi:hypothetical protein
MNDYRRGEELKAQRIESCERHQWKESVCLLDNGRATPVSRAIAKQSPPKAERPSLGGRG